MFKLGISIDADTPAELTKQAEAATQAGFRTCQLFYHGNLSEPSVREIQSICAEHDLEIGPVGGYINALKPQEKPMGYDLDRLYQLIELLPVFGSREVIIWSGTLSDEHMFQIDSRNFTQETAGKLREITEKLLQRLRPVNGTLLFEPFFTHVLHDEDAIVSFLSDFGSGELKTVLDPPNLMTPQRFEKLTASLHAQVERLAPHIGAVHFKDIVRLNEGDWPFDYPGPGQGSLDYGFFMDELKRIDYKSWAIVEHVKPPEYKAAREFIEAFL